MIIVDYRERGSGVVEALAKLGAPLSFEKLEVGDYLILGEVIVERKSCNDFLTSIVDKRLFEQARLMLQTQRKPVMIVEGDFAEVLAYRRIGYPQIYGAIAALIDMGVSVLRTGTPSETAYAIYYMYKRYAEPSKRSYLKPVKIKVLKDNKSIENIQLNMIASIPGISRELAHRILMHFKTPRRFFKASPSELRRVEGLGRERIARIVEVLDTIYPPAYLSGGGPSEGGPDSQPGQAAPPSG